ncbi:MAG: IclR family transcriptional regulator [Leucobacter sp.]
MRMNPAVSRALDILETLVERPDPPTLRALTEELGLPRSTVFELTNTLAARGYLVKSAKEPVTFTIGPRAFQLGSAFAERLDYVAIGSKTAQELSNRSLETSHVAILDGTHVVYIARAESQHPVRMVSSLGSRLPAHATAVGKALIAQLSEEEFSARFPADAELAPLTPNTIVDPARLAQECARIRERGYSLEQCESNVDVCCAAAAVRDSAGKVVAAISVSVPENRWVTRPAEQWAELVLESAGAYSRMLGYAARS